VSPVGDQVQPSNFQLFNFKALSHNWLAGKKWTAYGIQNTVKFKPFNYHFLE